MSFLKRRPAAEQDAQVFVATIPSTTVHEGKMTTAKVNDRKIILTRWEGQLYAFHSECPHAAADLSKGSLHRWKITCADHDYCFDIRDGRLTWPEDEYYRLRTFEVKEEGGVVMVKIVSSKQ